MRGAIPSSPAWSFLQLVDGDTPPAPGFSWIEAAPEWGTQATSSMRFGFAEGHGQLARLFPDFRSSATISS